MKYGLIGERLGHSFSKIIHGRLADYEYELCEIAPCDLDEFMRKRDFLGINVTIPYKSAVIPYLDEVEPAALKIGAVNTIVNSGGRLIGYNTDFYGMQQLISHAGVDVCGKKVAILGSGATSRTAQAVLDSLGAGEIVKVGRKVGEGIIDYNMLTAEHFDIDVIVNTTPVGMFPEIDECPVNIDCFKQLIGVIDVVYNPINTELILDARSRGIAAEGGLYMLVGQAVRACEIFLGKDMPDGTLDRIYMEILSEKESIVLIGMPGSGKSTVGEILAKRLGRRLVDTDELIVERIGMSIKDFFALKGEVEFRRIEQEVVGSIADEGSLVISTGGGAVLCEENNKNLRRNGRIFFIDRPLEAIMPTESRPLSSDRSALEKRYLERYPIYCSVCDTRIDASCDAEAVAIKILESFL